MKYIILEILIWFGLIVGMIGIPMGIIHVSMGFRAFFKSLRQTLSRHPHGPERP